MRARGMLERGPLRGAPLLPRRGDRTAVAALARADPGRGRRGGRAGRRLGRRVADVGARRVAPARAQSAHAPSVDSDLLIDDYVWHEVLGAEDADVVDVMMRTAVVDRVNGSLAEALTGRPDAGDAPAPRRRPWPVRHAAAPTGGSPCTRSCGRPSSPSWPDDRTTSSSRSMSAPHVGSRTLASSRRRWTTGCRPSVHAMRCGCSLRSTRTSTTRGGRRRRAG